MARHQAAENRHSDSCVVLAGLAQPGKIERGLRAEACKKHLHQLHVCLPAGVGKTRLLYRMSMDFLEWTRMVPFIDRFWASIANQASLMRCFCPYTRTVLLLDFPRNFSLSSPLHQSLPC